MSEANRGGKSRGEGVNTINRGVKSGGGGQYNTTGVGSLGERGSIQYNRGGKSRENGVNIIQQGCKVYGGS